jgi:spore photoproduct lyase
MYKIKPPRVYAHRRVYDNQRALERMERMLNVIDHPPVEMVDESDFDRIVRESLPPENLPVMTAGVFMGIENHTADPALLFNTFVWDKADRTVINTKNPNPTAQRLAGFMGGVGEDFAFSPPLGTYKLYEPELGGGLCNPGWGIHTLFGCLHKCSYCDKGYLMNIMLDIEDFAEHLKVFLKSHPEQKLFRYDVLSDHICMEPEYGASRILSEVFSETPDQYLLYYTKSDNVDHLLDLPKKRCIFYCTLSAETVCRDFEQGAPGMEERIEAMRKCQEAGYLIRVGFTPIVPLRGWQEEANVCIEKLLSAVKPELIRLACLTMMNAKEAETVIGASRLDPVCLEAMRKAASELDSVPFFRKPFPCDLRSEIYLHYINEIKRHSPDTLIVLCGEEREGWDMLKDHLKMRPDGIYCVCGARCVPELLPEYLRTIEN